MKEIRITSRDFRENDGCGRQHKVSLQTALIAPDAMQGFEDILHGCGFDSGECAVIYDENTYEALRGKHPRAKQEVVLPPEGLHANEHGVELAKARLGDAKLLIAAGAGTVHDITRYICAERGLPFGSVPTAASAASPSKRPTTITSAALKVSCNTLESIRGSANESSLGITGPFSMSIS